MSDAGMHARVVPLEGVHNFRDLGGYVTQDGRRVCWRRLFRSGTLTNMSPADGRVVADLGLRTICDLRSTAERESEPYSWTVAGARLMSWSYELGEDTVMGAFRLGVPTAERVRSAITEFYLSAPESFADQLRAVFRILIANQAPMVVHCTAGKDRTGFAAAILLRALGVPEREVVEDYTLTDRLVNYEELYRAGVWQRNGAWAFLARLPTEIRAPLLAAEPGYIDATLRRVAERYGTVERYLADRLGVTDAELSRLRDLYLE